MKNQLPKPRLRLIMAVACLACIILIGCKPSEPNLFSESSQKVSISKEDTLRSTIFSDTILGVSNLFAYNDYVVLFGRNGVREKLFSVVNKNGEMISEFGTSGNANDEFITSFFTGQYYVKADQSLVIWVSDNAKMSLKALNITQSIKNNQAVIEKVVPMAGFALEVFAKNDSTLVLLAQTDTGVELVLFDCLKEKQISSKPLYHTILPMDNMMCYNSDWAMTPNGERLVGGMSSVDQINICAFDGTDRTAITTANAFSDFNTALDQNSLPKWLYYEKVVATDDLIYALYSNVSYENSSSDNSKSEIQIFDMEGNGLYAFPLDRYIYSFSVDLENGLIYGLDLEDSIWKFTLPKYALSK